MSARAFEAYVIKRLAGQGARSDCLANITSEEKWEHEGTYPYPADKEMEIITPAFDKLFETIQTRTHEDGRVEMYSIADVMEVDTGKPKKQMMCVKNCALASWELLSGRWLKAGGSISLKRRQDACQNGDRCECSRWGAGLDRR